MTNFHSVYGNTVTAMVHQIYWHNRWAFESLSAHTQYVLILSHAIFKQSATWPRVNISRGAEGSKRETNSFTPTRSEIELTKIANIHVYWPLSLNWNKSLSWFEFLAIIGRDHVSIDRLTWPDFWGFMSALELLGVTLWPFWLIFHASYFRIEICYDSIIIIQLVPYSINFKTSDVMKIMQKWHEIPTVFAVHIFSHEYCLISVEFTIETKSTW